MSFARAKRFDDRGPDYKGSPADFNVSSNLEKGFSIPKGPRFKDKGIEKPGEPCPRLNCTKETHGDHCKTAGPEKFSTPKAELNKQSNPSLSRASSVRSSTRKLSFKNSTPQPVSSSSSESSHRPCSSSSSNFSSQFSSQSALVSSTDFIDDDYYSLSSEDRGSLRDTKFEYRDIFAAFRECQQNQKNTFENHVLTKISNLEQTIEHFRNDFTAFANNINAEHLRANQALQMSKIEDLRAKLEKSIDQISNERRTEIQDIIAKAIGKLKKSFEIKKKALLKENEEKIKKLADEIHRSTNCTTKEIEQLCDNTAKNLTKRLVNMLSKNSEMNVSDNDSASEAGTSTIDSHNCFNYENICKVLSDHLQLTKEENDYLEQLNTNITLKYEDTQEALVAQASVIDMLQKELRILKKGVQKY